MLRLTLSAAIFFALPNTLLLSAAAHPAHQSHGFAVVTEPGIATHTKALEA